MTNSYVFLLMITDIIQNDCRKLNPNADHFERKKHFGKQETFKTTQKVVSLLENDICIILTLYQFQFVMVLTSLNT